MIVVLTNDDGVEAPGLAALADAVASLGIQPVVVAPSREWSGCGHRVTTGEVLRVERREGGVHVVDGTPGDCVRMALHTLARDARWVIAGINAGGNLGADIVHSGTVAAAREATLHGRHAIAVSHYLRRGAPVDWALAARRAAGVLRELLAEPPGPARLWNVNLPHPEPGAPEPRVVRCLADPSPLPLDFRPHEDGLRYCGDYHRRARSPGHDVDVCFGGSISVSDIGFW